VRLRPAKRLPNRLFEKHKGAILERNLTPFKIKDFAGEAQSGFGVKWLDELLDMGLAILAMNPATLKPRVAMLDTRTAKPLK
jgi:hypothetical protein